MSKLLAMLLVIITAVLAAKINFSPPVTTRKLCPAGITTPLIKYAAVEPLLSWMLATTNALVVLVKLNPITVVLPGLVVVNTVVGVVPTPL